MNKVLSFKSIKEQAQNKANTFGRPVHVWTPKEGKKVFRTTYKRPKDSEIFPSTTVLIFNPQQ